MGSTEVKKEITNLSFVGSQLKNISILYLTFTRIYKNHLNVMELINVYNLNDYIHSLISFNQKIIFQSTENIWLSQYVNKIIRLHSHKSTKLCQDQILLNILGFILTRAVGVSIGRPSGGRLATTLVATINIVFSPFPPSSTFLIEGVFVSKKLFGKS